MFSLLLPLDANPARHAEEHPLPDDGTWTDLLHDCWNRVLTIFKSHRR